jgi:uncharacterized protein involved in exopolysaccharide biosynthesis
MSTQIRSEIADLEPSTAVVPVLGLVGTVWRRRWLVALITGVTLAASLVLVAIMPPSYDARMVVAPVMTQQNLASKLGGLTSLGSAIGINLNGANDEFEKFQLLLTSSIVAARLEQQHGNQVLTAMFPGQWNTATEQWVEPEGPRAVVGRGLRSLFGLPGWAPPTANSLAKLLKRRVHVNRVPETDLLEVTFADRNPEFARDLLLWLYTAADGQLRDATLASARQERTYVNRKLKTETVVEDRQALVEVLFQLEQKIMMAHATGSYAAIVVDGPSVSDLPDSPKPAWFIVFGILFGLMFGTTAAVIADAVKSRRQPR